MSSVPPVPPVQGDDDAVPVRPHGADHEPGEPPTLEATATSVSPRDRWRRFGAPVLAALIIPTLCLGVLLGWLAFGERSPGDASVDAGFARDMSEHHAQASQMSMLVMQRTDDEQVRRLAADIVNNQEFERGMMATWLEDWGLPRSREGARMAWMKGHDHASMDLPAGVAMPGMASPSDIQELTDSSGKAAEVLFLQLMTTHHLSGVEMAQAALADASDPRVVAAAQKMVDAQSGEVALMRDLLADRGAKPREDVDAWLAQHGGGHSSDAPATTHDMGTMDGTGTTGGSGHSGHGG